MANPGKVGRRRSLTDKDLQNIRLRVEKGEKIVALAEEFGVSRQTIHKWIAQGGDSEGNEYIRVEDTNGYESLSACIVSGFLYRSSLKDQAAAYVPRMEKTGDGSRRISVCEVSSQGEKVAVPLREILDNVLPVDIDRTLSMIPDCRDRISYTVEAVEAICGIHDFGKFLSNMLTVDALFLNSFRDLSNIFLNNTGKKSYAPLPYTDFGRMIFSDLKEDFPDPLDFIEYCKKLSGGPFSKNIDEQAAVAKELYGLELSFGFTKSEALDKSNWFINSGDIAFFSDEELSRVENILRMQVAKYKKIFKSSF